MPNLCLLFMVCGKVGLFLQVLYMFLDQYDQENFRAHIIRAACGLVSCKPQRQPPFWVFHYFTHFVYVLPCSTEIWSGIVLNLFLVNPCDFVDLFGNCPCGHHIFIIVCSYYVFRVMLYILLLSVLLKKNSVNTDWKNIVTVVYNVPDCIFYCLELSIIHL